MAALGARAARELLDVLRLPEVDRAALIGRLHQREDALWLAELLIEIESDPDEVMRLQLVEPSGRLLGRPTPSEASPEDRSGIRRALALVRHRGLPMARVRTRRWSRARRPGRRGSSFRPGPLRGPPAQRKAVRRGRVGSPIEARLGPPSC